MIRKIKNEDVEDLRAAVTIFELPDAIEEVVRNSVEGGAKAIRIRLLGKRSFEVSDNGNGVSPEGMNYIGERYYTSKDNHQGESLSSLVSSSKSIIITSRVRYQYVGLLKSIIGTQHGSISEVPMSVGTVVVVNNLCEKYPVRRTRMDCIPQRTVESKLLTRLRSISTAVKSEVVIYFNDVPLSKELLYDDHSLELTRTLDVTNSKYSIRGTVWYMTQSHQTEKLVSINNWPCKYPLLTDVMGMLVQKATKKKGDYKFYYSFIFKISVESDHGSTQLFRVPEIGMQLIINKPDDLVCDFARSISKHLLDIGYNPPTSLGLVENVWVCTVEKADYKKQQQQHRQEQLQLASKEASQDVKGRDTQPQNSSLGCGEQSISRSTSHQVEKQQSELSTVMDWSSLGKQREGSHLSSNVSTVPATDWSNPQGGHNTTTLKEKTSTLSRLQPSAIITVAGQSDSMTASMNPTMMKKKVQFSTPIKRIRSEKVVKRPSIQQLKEALSISEVPKSSDDCLVGFCSYTADRYRTARIQQPVPERGNGTQNEGVSTRRRDVEGMIFIGQSHNQFLVAKTNSYIYFVDQHAADERLSLEKLQHLYTSKQLVRTSNTQKTVKVSLHQREVILNNEQVLTRLGWSFDSKENSIHIRGIPEFHFPEWCAAPRVVEVSADSLVQSAEELSAAGGSPSLVPSVFEKLLASKACRSAIMFGTPLSKDCSTKLITSLSCARDPFHCAHGRPSVAPSLSMSSLPVGNRFRKPDLRNLCPQDE